MKIEILKSADGSHTLYLPELDETYHSRHGAVQEALHVFIHNGLNSISPGFSEIKILEIGWGTGLNSLLTFKEAKKKGLRISYTGIEKFPVPNDVLEQLNYRDWNEDDFLEKAYSAEWSVETHISDFFKLTKLAIDVNDFITTDQFDIIYFDAFGPRAQGDMWNKELFEQLYELTSTEGVFVTYCAKGQVRRDLQEVGYRMERLPGPPGKREMLRGVK